MKALKIILALVLLGVAFPVWAQPRHSNTDYLYNLSPGQAQDSLRAYELRLKDIGDSIRSGSNVFVRMHADSIFIPIFVTALKIPGSINYPFDSLVWMKKLSPGDKKFRIYNWPLAYNDGSYFYHGAIQLNTPKGLKLIPLRDFSHKLDTSMMGEELTKDQWFGALYYELIECKNKKEVYYTLIGWEGNNRISHRKIIDALRFDENNMPIFGAPVFMVNGKAKNRIIFDYNVDAEMVVQYDEGKKTIACDHLVPPTYKGTERPPYYTYVPDGTYEYYLYKKGKWIMQDSDPHKSKKPLEDALPH